MSIIRNELSLRALDWYDKEQVENEYGITRDSFHLFVLGLIEAVSREYEQAPIQIDLAPVLKDWAELQDLRARIEALPEYLCMKSIDCEAMMVQWREAGDQGYLKRDDVLALLPPPRPVIDHGAPPRTNYEMPKKVWPQLKEKV